MFDSVTALLASVLVGYVIGALPLAYRISRRRGVDIFAAGTRLAGAANVRRLVNTYVAAVVLLGDIAKGVVAIACGRLLGVDDAWIIIVAMAVVVGHWHSVFTGFRGGDGLATLGGVTIALFPIHGFIAASVAAAVALGAQKTPITSLMGIVFGYITLAALGFAYELDLALTLGVGGVASLVLARAIMSKLRLKREDFEELSEAESAPDQSRS